MPKRQNLKGPGACIFCGRAGLNKEHVLSFWIRKLLRSPSTATHLKSAVGHGPGTTLPLVQAPTIGQGSLLSKQVRVVCRLHCNNGWMDKLERRAKPHLLPLIYSKPHVITRYAQLTVSTWLAKSTMTAEHIYRGEVVIPQEQRSFLMERQEPPAGWQIWITPIRSPKYIASLTHFVAFDALMRKGTHEEIASPQLTFIGLNGLLAHVYSTSSTTTWLDLNAVVGSPFTQIWPITTEAIVWPNRPPLDDGQIDRLISDAAKAFGSSFKSP